MVTKELGKLLVGAASALLLAACGSGTAAPVDSKPEPTKLTVAYVPSLELGLIKLAEEKGYLAEEGVEVELVPLDSGPNVVTGVVAGQYDIGSTAYAPPLLALAEGAPLRIVTNTGQNGPDGTNGGVFVRADSGINTWSDLAGKKIASNAPRSLFSLTVPAAIKADGGDPSGIEIVPLPFSEIAGAVESGQVDAGVALEPFLTAGLANSALKNLGDSIFKVLPTGAAGVFFTSADTKSAKADAIEGFKTAIQRAMEDANADPNSVKILGAPIAGLTAEQATALPLTTFRPEVSEADLKALIDLMIEFQWISESPDLAGFLG